MQIEEKYMRRALQLAEFGKGTVSPNPMVGCVIVHEGQIIGEGWHRKYGEAHAEVNAINSVKDETLLESADVYVTLEPCAHFGKTPPCADLLVDRKAKRVIIATTDPNPKVAGKGIKKLEGAGIEVITGICEKEARKQNRRFFTALQHHRPYIILKWAETKDGFIARKDFSSKWISGIQSRQLVHKWRAEEDAIMVGRNTAYYDNPSLNVRDWVGKDPLRIVVDRELRLEGSLKVFSDRIKTICYNLKKDTSQGAVDYIKLAPDHFLQDLITDLGNKNIQSLIVEGGASLIDQFIKLNLWDEARRFVSPITFEEGIHAPLVKGHIISCNFVGQDELTIISNNEWLKT